MLIGLGLIYLSVATAWDTLQLQLHGESTQGQVIDRTFGGKQKVVTVRFTTSDGQELVAADRGTLLPDSGTVDVRYDRRDPQRIRIGDWQSFYTKAAVLGAGGVALLAIGLWICPRHRKAGLQTRVPEAVFMGGPQPERERSRAGRRRSEGQR